jgi:CubicO group peptidase (beta-lactamase class C family)
VANIQVGPTLRQLVDDQAANRSAELADWLDRAMTLGGALMPELVGPDAGFNNALVQQAEIPGAGGIATASALAAIWSATITTTNGSRLLSDESVRLGTEVQSQGSPVWAVPGPWPRWGMGFQLDSDSRRYLGSTGFGHDGAGGQVAFADPEFGVGFAFITNQMEAIEDFRATKIVDALRQALTR